MVVVGPQPDLCRRSTVDPVSCLTCWQASDLRQLLQGFGLSLAWPSSMSNPPSAWYLSFPLNMSPSRLNICS